MTNKEKFKAMTRKQKIDYIWEYYKWHIIGAIAVIFIIGEVYRIATTPKTEYKVHTIVAGKLYMDTELEETIQERFYDKFESDIYFMPTDWSNVTQATMNTDQLLNLKIQVREADLLALSETRHKIFMEIDRFDPFVALDTLPELQPLLEKHQDQLIKGLSREDGKEHVYGIRVDKVPGIPEVGFGEPMIISIVQPPKDLQQTIQVFKYLLEE